MNIIATIALGSAITASFLSGTYYFLNNIDNNEPAPPSSLLLNKNRESAQWSGIGKIFVGSTPQCTASLIDTSTDGSDGDSPAYILTAGHCVTPRADTSFADIPFHDDKGTISFNYFNDTPEEYKTYKITSVRWSTLRGSDIAILELDSSLATLVSEGIQPYKISHDPASVIENIRIIGAPEGLTEKGLRIANCSQEPVKGTLIELYQIIYPGTMKNQCTDIRKGSSGSPVFDQDSQQISSVLVTSTYGSTIEQQCRTDSPCEVIDGQPQWIENTHYSQTIDHLNACFIDGSFDIKAEACPLNAGPTFEELSRIKTFSRIQTNSEGEPIHPEWNLRFALDTNYYRYKTTSDASDCKNPNNYSQALSTQDARIGDIIGTTPGISMLCILGVESTDERSTSKQMESAIILASHIAEPGPTPTPELEITVDSDGTYHVEWLRSTPFRYLSYYTAGAPESTDCNAFNIPLYIKGSIQQEGFQIPFEVVKFSVEQLPVKICSFTRDESSQASAVREDILR